MGKVLELKQHYGEEQARIINQVAELGYRANQIENNLASGAQKKLGDANTQLFRAAEQAAWAEERREEFKTEYIRLDAERTAAIEEARLAAEAELAPRDVSPEAVLLAVEKSEQALIDAMDAAATLGEAGTETIKLCLAMARQKEDYDMAIAHALQLVPELEDAYEDVLLASQAPDLGPEDSFEMFADQAPSKESLLVTPQPDINVYDQMRQ